MHDSELRSAQAPAITVRDVCLRADIAYYTLFLIAYYGLRVCVSEPCKLFSAGCHTTDAFETQLGVDSMVFDGWQLEI